MRATVHAPGSTVGSAFDWEANGLNAVRLVLASGVIIWHSFPLTGRDIGFPPLRQLLAWGWVDGIFAASGFLIMASWTRRPAWAAFLTARLLRIMPPFWACLLFIGFLFVPAVLVLAGQTLPGDYWSDAVSYFVANSLLWVFQPDIAGTPAGVPFTGAWNGSLWTLWWEFLCYLGVLVLGLLRLLTKRWAVEAVFLLGLAATLLTAAGITSSTFFDNAGRFTTMFAAGALVYRHRDHIPVRWPLVSLAAVVVVAAAWLPNYRVVAALPVAYLVIVAGAGLRHPVFRLRNDISYGVYIYAFPVQQALAVFGLYALPPLAFGAATVIPTVLLATASWWLIEKPALRLRRPATSAIDRMRLGRRSPAQPAADGKDGVAEKAEA